MLLLIFAATTAAFVSLQAGRGRIAIVCAAAAFALATALFLYEIHGPATGFGMPWLQVRDAPAPDMSPA